MSTSQSEESIVIEDGDKKEKYDHKQVPASLQAYGESDKPLKDYLSPTSRNTNNTRIQQQVPGKFKELIKTLVEQLQGQIDSAAQNKKVVGLLNESKNARENGPQKYKSNLQKENMQEIHDNCVDIKVTKSFYDK